MATAIDFQALLKQERAKALAALQQEKGESCEASQESKSDNNSEKSTAKPRSPIDLKKFSVGAEILDGVFYIPNFIDQEEADQILKRVYEMPASCWTNLRRRRLQNHGGTPHPDGMIPERIPRFLSAVLDSLVQSGIFPADAPPNHILLNEYTHGQGIMPHKDGPLYRPLVAILSLDGPAMLQFWDSLAATKAGRAVASILCQPNSLLIFSADAYESHWHGILESESDIIQPHTVNRQALDAADAAAAAAAAGSGAAAEGAAAAVGAPAAPPQFAVGCAVPRGDRRVSLTMRRVEGLRDADSRIATAEAAEEERRKTRWWLTSRGEEGFKLT